MGGWWRRVGAVGAVVAAMVGGASGVAVADGEPDVGALAGGHLGGSFLGLFDAAATRYASEVARDATGRWLVAANATASSGTGGASAVARYLPSGTLDATFGDGGYARPILSAMHPGITTLVELPDGRIVTGSLTESRLAVFDGSGRLVDRVGIDLAVERLVGLPDGRIIAAGMFRSGPGVRVVGHVDDGASVVERWDLPAGLPELSGSSVAVDASGRVYDTICSNYLYAPRCVVVAFAPSGVLDTTYGIGGLLELPISLGASSTRCATDVAPDGYLVAACPRVGGGVEVREYNPNGRPEPDLTPSVLNAIATLEGYTRVAVEGTGRIFVATVEQVSSVRPWPTSW